MGGDDIKVYSFNQVLDEAKKMAGKRSHNPHVLNLWHCLLSHAGSIISFQPGRFLTASPSIFPFFDFHAITFLPVGTLKTQRN
jgi:hypothetical protein